MKTAVVIDCFRKNREVCGLFTERVRRETKAERILWIAGCEFEPDGMPAASPVGEDAAHLVKAGADAVIIPPKTALLDRAGTEIFAQTALVSRLHFADCIAVPVSGRHSGEELKKLAMFLFTEPRDFQRAVRMKMADGASMEEAKRSCAESFIPGASGVLADPLDGPAVELQKCMFQLYCCIRVEWIPMGDCLPMEDSLPDGTLPDTDGETLFGSKDTDEYFFSLLGECAADPHFEERVSETAGGSAAVRDIAVSRPREFGALGAEDRSELRKFILRLLAGIRMADSQMCGLHTYCPYARLYAQQDVDGSEWLSELRRASWAPLYTDREMQEAAERDPGIGIFRTIDASLQKIYDGIGRGRKGNP